MTRGQAKTRIAMRAARELWSSARVNLGIGLPTLIPSFLEANVKVWIHSENGFFGMGGACAEGEEDADLIDAGGRYVKLVPGAACFDSALSFAMVRGGHIDICFLGAFQVDMQSNLANWRTAGPLVPGIGGAMELAQKVPRVVALTHHTEASGTPKLIDSCRLPLTAKGAVSLVITELAVLEPVGDAFRVLELAEGVDIGDVKAATAAPIQADAIQPWRS